VSAVAGLTVPVTGVDAIPAPVAPAAPPTDLPPARTRGPTMAARPRRPAWRRIRSVSRIRRWRRSIRCRPTDGAIVHCGREFLPADPTATGRTSTRCGLFAHAPLCRPSLDRMGEVDGRWGTEPGPYPQKDRTQ